MINIFEACKSIALYFHAIVKWVKHPPHNLNFISNLHIPYERTFQQVLNSIVNFVPDRKETSLKAGGIWTEPFPGQGYPPNHTVSADETEVSNFHQSRIHYSRSNYPSDTMSIQLFGRIGDTYMVRVSTRSSPFHKLDGYLKPPKSSVISVCVQSQFRWACSTEHMFQHTSNFVLYTIDEWRFPRKFGSHISINCPGNEHIIPLSRNVPLLLWILIFSSAFYYTFTRVHFFIFLVFSDFHSHHLSLVFRFSINWPIFFTSRA